MTELLNRLVRETVDAETVRDGSRTLEKETRLAEVDMATVEDNNKVGRPSMYSCPDCGGVLWELDDADFPRFRCRVGHEYSAAALGEEQSASLEKGLWSAFRSLEEHASFARRLALRARRAGNANLAERYMARAEEAAENAQAVQQMIVEFEHVDDVEPVSE